MAISDPFAAGQLALLEKIASGADLRDVLEGVVRLIESQADGLLCSILLVDREKQTVHPIAAPNLPAAYTERLAGAHIGPRAGSCGAAAALGERVIVEDIATHPYWTDYKDLALPHALRACWSSPIFSPDREVLGTFAIYYQESRGPAPRELEWVDTATHLAAVALMRDRAEESRRQSDAQWRRLARLYAVSSLVNEAIVRVRDPQQLYDMACRVAVDQGFARLAWVGLADDGGNRIRPVAQFGPTGYVERIALSTSDSRINRGPSGRALRSGTYAISNDIASDPDFFWKDEALALGLRSCAVFPLKTHDTPSGIFAIYTDHVGLFGDEELRVLTALADDISFAVDSVENERERKRLVHDLGERVKELTLLHGVARLLQANRAFDREFLRDLITLFPSAWQYPEVCAARIVWRDLEAETPGFRETPWRQSAPLTAGDGSGTIDVVYLEERPFLTEEDQLIESVADMLSTHLNRAHMEQVARSSEALRSLIYNSVTDIVFYLAVEPGERFRFMSVNAAFVTAVGMTEDQIVGRRVDEIVPESYRAMLLTRYREAVRSAGPVTWEALFTHGGETKHGDITLVPIFDPTGTCSHLLGTVHDITSRKKADEERRQLETQLHRSQRLQSLGTLAGGIAHDFNNILTAVGGHVDLATVALEEADGRAHVLESLDEIGKAGARARDLVKRILMFSRQDEPHREMVSVAALVEEPLDLLEATLPREMVIRRAISADVPRIIADPTQIHQVLMNLCTNAQHACGEKGGMIDVSVDCVQVDGPRPDVPIDLHEGRYVRITVSDTGCGMDAATLARAFEPFFTTKPKGEGTGLGLSVVHGIMKSHQGGLAVHSELGAGTTFRLYFPAVESTPPVPSPAPVTSQRGDGEHVLYVEDDAALLFLGTRLLERLGFRTTSFSDPIRALQEFRGRPNEFDILVTDSTMPGLSGISLVEQVRAIRPDIPAVLVSGYVSPADMDAAQQLGVKSILLKPHTPEELMDTIRRVIDQRGKERV